MLLRRYKVKRKVGSEVAEVPFQPTGSTAPARLIIRRDRIENRRFDGQWLLFDDEYVFRYVVTNLPHAYSAADIVDLTNDRCDQENVIEQFKNGLAGWHATVREFDGNAARLQLARLTWNLGKAIAILGLPADAVRWEWKRLRRTTFLVPAIVIRRSRQTWIRISAHHLYSEQFATAHLRLCT